MDAPLEENYDSGFLGSFLSNSLKTNQLEVLDERIYHIEYAPDQPEPYYQPTGKELQPRPVGEENGVVVYNYNPINSNSTSSNNSSSCSSNGSKNASNSDYGSYNDEPDFWNEINFSLNSNIAIPKTGLKKRLTLDGSDADDDDEGTATDHDDSENSVPSSSQTLNCRRASASSCTSIESVYNSEIESVQCYDGDVDEDHLQNMDKNPSLCTCVNLVDRKIFCSCSLSNLSQVEKKNKSRKNYDEKLPTRTKISNNKIKTNNKNVTTRASRQHKSTTKKQRNASQQQFSRSAVGGSKYLLSCHPTLEPTDLIFESRFESGNLAKAVKITPTYYELYLRSDMYTNRHTQWFYFRVKNTKKNVVYRFSIINLTKPDSLYKEGMRPLMYSVSDATNRMIGWRRCGENIAYFRNDDNGYSINSFANKFVNQNGEEEEEELLGNVSFTLTFNIEFEHDNDTVYFAHSYPYTYSDLQDYLMAIQRHPVKSKFCKLRLLCRSLAGNNVYYLTVTAPSTPEDENQKKKKAIVISGRVHAGESPASWMMKGFMDFITGDSFVAKKLRHKFIFKLIPMLNPDGVIVGNTRSSLTGRDLNRQYRTVIRETYPSIWNTKAMIKRLMEDCGVAMYCDMHAHSRKHNIFIYGCENLKRHPDRRLLEQVFPLMLHKNVADKFSFENCKFKVQKNKEGTGRIVVWVLGVTNSYTLEASFAGSTMGSRNGTHFSTADFEHIGRAYCETLMDYYDDNPVKVNKYLKIIDKMRKKERKLKRQMKAAKKSVVTASQLNYESKIKDETQTYRTITTEPDLDHTRREFRHSVRRILRQRIQEQIAQEEKENIQKSNESQSKKKSEDILLSPEFLKSVYHSHHRMAQRNEKKKQYRLKREEKARANCSASEQTDDSAISTSSDSPRRRRDRLEKLRLKILTRLSKEGSSADEPLNIPLSDYSSDEGDTSSTSTDDEGKDRLSDLEGPCCQPLKVPPCSPVHEEKPKKKVKKHKTVIKVSSSGGKKKNKSVRTTMSVPTTDPGSDFFELSTDEELTDTEADGTVTRVRTKSKIRSTEGYKKLVMYESQTTQLIMPPELIITSAKAIDDNQEIVVGVESDTEKDAQDSQSACTKQNDTAINDKNTASTKNILKELTQQQSQKKDKSELKLSLKKQIWTGTHSAGDTTTMDISRPLSWGKGQIMRPVHYDSMALLTACSRKLAEWQETQGDGPRIMVQKGTSNNGGRSPQTQPNIQSSNTTITALPNQTYTNNKERDTTSKPLTEKKLSPVISEATNGMAKVRKKTKALCRIVQTTDILNQFTKNTGKASPPQRTVLTPVKSALSKDKRFKTSGLVATAVQSSHTRGRLLHSSHGRSRSHHRTNHNINQKQFSTLAYSDSVEVENCGNGKIPLKKTKSNSTNSFVKNKLGNEHNKKI
uniref:CSON013163 protein n=1 Tax=Culicoides sonorensis TaxID=179676 RepID=A0A336KP57_CULSO